MRFLARGGVRMRRGNALVLACVVVSLWGQSGLCAERQATSPRSIRALEGFRVQLLRSAQEEESSWISLTFDDRGDLIIGLDDRGLARLVLSEDRSSAEFQRLQGTDEFRHVRGVLHAHNSLYVCATNSQQVYRLFDRNGDGEYEDHQLLQEIPYQSRYGHGTNQIVLGPDGMLYVVCGNDVVFPEDMAKDSPYRAPQNDWLLPHPHDAGQDNRVGYIARVDPEGKSWEILAGGFRNQFDMAINRDGEMFTWDADMEWDAGLPWYRPTRLNHIIRGGEYGWRWGTGKWPAWYPDSLPTTLDTGYGSPTGMIFGHSSNWPERFREALFMADWQHGRILLVDLQPQGATYAATSQLFLEGGPLNVCDLVFGPDGAMYFITGGRGSQSGLYRVTWEGGAEPPATPKVDPQIVQAAEAARKVRQQIERFQKQQDPASLDFLWEQLSSQDDWLRFSARVAWENQPVETWRERILAADDSLALRTALLAWARQAEPADQPQILAKLAELDWESAAQMAEDSPLGLLLPLRTLQLTLIRQGIPTEALPGNLQSRLDRLYPRAEFSENWLLAELLVALNVPGTLERTLDLLDQAPTQEEQVQYAKTLMHISAGWNREYAARFVAWLERSRGMPGGKLVDATWKHLRTDAEALLGEALRKEFADRFAKLDEPLPEEALPTLPERPIVQRWTMQDLLEDAQNLQPEEHSPELGRQALAAGLCLRCHRFGNRGGQIGPDLTSVGKRFDAWALLESIIEPSKQIDEKYLNVTYVLTDGRVVTGRTVGVNRHQLTIEIDPLTAKTISIPREDIEESLPTKISPMPAGLLDTLPRDEILALLALLRR